LTLSIPDYDAKVTAPASGTDVRVPFLDLARIHAPLSDVLAGEFEALMRSSAFVNGEAVRAFEAEFAAYCGASAAVGVASGLDALRLALAALDIGLGDEVIVPSMTFVATWEAVSQVGAVPVPVDITESDYNVDVGAVAAAIGHRTAAIIPVHLYGQMADMEGLVAVSAHAGIPLIEDAAQAHGAMRDGRRAGGSGPAAAFSFYPGKNLGAFGDAGALTTNDERVVARVRALREHGQSRKYHHDEVGWTSRLDTIQAAVLSRKLARLDGWNEERRAIAALYLDALAEVGDLGLPNVPDRSSPVWHLFVIRTADPTGLADHLAGLGVGSGRHYPQPPHLSGAYSSAGYREGEFPVAEALGRECLSLPIFPAMTELEVLRVTEAVQSWFAGG
jgi:dTDP-4-amino-4,6-dideoxygalactose transaminase